MTQWIAVSRTQHADKHYLPREGYDFASKQPMAQVLLAELAKLLPHYPLGFIKQGEHYVPVALLGTEQNLYVAPSGKWLGKYVPASLRGYPFTLASNETGEKALAIEADYLSDDAGKPLFAEGEPTKSVADTLAFLTQCENNRQTTQAACQALESAGILTPWPLTVPIGESRKRFNGLYRVDEQALNTLDAETYATLQGAPMQLAYAQLYSIAQTEQLTQRAALQERLAQAQAPANLDELFGEEDDDLEFDFGS
ncbi:SapC family protein [Halomonas sp. Bachu 37]|uniref:SapC family protein n=1 Tax=Halomonas kashgarensis TaxID=3084920 RepID=UPI00321760EA